MTVRFDQMAKNIRDTVEIPAESGYDRFVGGDHLDSNDLHIKRWGSTTDVEAQKLLFKKGHILFGKRNAYLRKVALADFEGVCSAHMLVLEPIPGFVLPEFLPFFMQTDQFWERALMISEGSMSPTIKWRTLAEQEFVVPPLDEQRRIAEILWAADEAVEVFRGASSKSSQTMQIVMDQLFRYGIAEGKGIRDKSNPSLFKRTIQGYVPVGWELCAIDEMLDRIIDYRGKTPEKSPSGIPLITAKNIRQGYIDPEPQEFILPETYAERMTRGIPKLGDIFFTTEAPLGYIARVPSYQLSPGQRIITLVPNQAKLDTDFLFWLLQWPISQQEIANHAHGTTVVGIKQSVFRKVRFRFPPLEEQRQIGAILNQFEHAHQQIEEHLETLTLFKQMLINQVIHPTA